MFDLIDSGNAPLTMTSREVAELTGKRHDHVLRDIKVMLSELGDTSSQIWGELPDSYGRPQRVAHLPRRECMILVSGYSIPMRARIVDRWEALETGKAVPAVSGAARAAEDMVVLSALADALRLEGSARLGVMRKGMEIVAPHLLPAVPVYAIDAPNGSSSDIGSEPTASLSELLQEHSAGLSAASANKRLESLGYLEQMQRPSSRGGVKKYWSVTKTGAKYGKNATSDRNQRETQPVWYRASAAAMIQEIKSA